MKNRLKKLACGIIVLGLTGTFQSCKEKAGLPVITTAEVTQIMERSAISGGNVTDDGGAVVHTRGICWRIDPDPYPAWDRTIDGSGTGTFTSTMTGLKGNTTYYIRAYAYNSEGVSYGNEVSFKTGPITIDPPEITFSPNQTYGTVTDIEGNTYKTIQIGNQVWMAENLRTTKYNDGTAIPAEQPHEPGWTSWANLSEGAYCWFDNDEGYHRMDYGAIYNWYAVSAGKLCPAGWHVPDLSNWKALVTSLGKDSTQGFKLRETGTKHWSAPNTGATNEIGFTALPGGCFEMQRPYFCDLGKSGEWWSSTLGDNGKIGKLEMTGSSLKAEASGEKVDGYSVRCVRD